MEDASPTDKQEENGKDVDEEGSQDEDKEEEVGIESYSNKVGTKPGAGKEAKTKNKDLQWIFSPDRDEHAKPYAQDGNPLMYTDENVKKRADLKKDSLVDEAIKETNKENNITRDEYNQVFFKIGGVLLPKCEKEKLQQKIVDEYDTEFPSNPEFITRDLLAESLFNLCDIWCPNIDAQEYKEFFDVLKFKIRYEGHSNIDAYDLM